MFDLHPYVHIYVRTVRMSVHAHCWVAVWMYVYFLCTLLYVVVVSWYGPFIQCVQIVGYKICTIESASCLVLSINYLNNETCLATWAAYHAYISDLCSSTDVCVHGFH